MQWLQSLVRGCSTRASCHTVAQCYNARQYVTSEGQALVERATVGVKTVRSGCLHPIMRDSCQCCIAYLATTVIVLIFRALLAQLQTSGVEDSRGSVRESGGCVGESG
jgi:hypothetical protein